MRGVFSSATGAPAAQQASVQTRRRALQTTSGALLAASLAGCGFALRQAPDFDFTVLGLAMPANTALALELRRQLEGTGRVRVITDAAHLAEAQVVLESAGEKRERVVVSKTATGEVREIQLRLRLAFRLRTPDGRELAPTVELTRQIDQSYAESAALSKEQETLLLYQNMQADLVQQVVRRLATVRLGA